MSARNKNWLLGFLNDKLHTPTWLFILLIIVFILRIPSFFEPYSYGDEMIYLTLGEAIRRGIPLYSGIHDNKPPLLYILAAIAGSLFWFKAILAIWSLVTIFLFWKLSIAMFPSGPETLKGRRPKKESLQKISTIIFALLITIPLLEGNIINAELFMIAPTIIAFLIILTRELNFKNIFTAGLFFSFATLFKIPAIFDIPAVIILWLVIPKKYSLVTLKKIGLRVIYLGLGFIIPIALTFVWYTLRGAFKEYLIAAYLQNVGYLSSFRPGDVAKPFLERNGPLLLRFGIASLGLLIMFLKRRKLSPQFIFITSWLLMTLFAVTLSERPYPHYLIQSVGPISLLLGILFTLRNIEQLLVILPLTLTLYVPVYYRFWHYPTLPYYTRFVNFALGKITKDQYLSTFGGQVQRNYKIANYILSLTKPEEKVFIWGDSSPIYALSRRLPPGKYVADYHIKDFSNLVEVMNNLRNSPPVLIVILPNSNPFSDLIIFLRNNYGLVEIIDSAQIWKLLGPNLRGLNNYGQ